MIQEPNKIAHSQQTQKLYETQTLPLKTTQNIIPIIIETNSSAPPRILLITRPTKNKTNKIIAVTNTENNQNNLKSNNSCETCLRTAQTYQIQQNQINQPQAVSVPFLPAPESQMPSVKKNLHLKNGSVKNSNLKVHLNEETLTLEEQAVNILTETDYQQQLQMLYNSNPNTNQLIQSENNKRINILKTELNSNNKINSSNMGPMTLASMAGIQLTSAEDMSLTGMSGAMSPTATVEEIDVPVFIDEYLQQSALKTSKTAITITAEATNINNNYNKNNNNTINNGTNNGNEICIEDGTYENFNFDFDLIVEELKNSIKEDPLQMYFEENKNNNDSSNNNNNYEDRTYNLYNMNDSLNLLKNDDDDNEDLFKTIFKQEASNNINNNNSNSNINNNSNTNNNNYTNTNNIPLHYQFSSDSINNYINFNSQDDNLINGTDEYNMMSSEDAIDISQVTNETFSFEDIFNSSQNNPMLCGETVATAIQGVIGNAEPHLSNLDDNEFYMYKNNSKTMTNIEQVNTIPLTPSTVIPDIKMPMSIINPYEVTCNDYAIKTEFDNSLSKDNAMVTTNDNAFVTAIPTTTVSGNLKRPASSTKGIMLEKRRKLCLDTSLRVKSPGFELKTPDVVNLITEMSYEDEQSMNNKNSLKILDVVELLNASDASFQSATADFYEEAFTEAPSPAYLSSSKYSDTDDESPYTPQSFTSSTSHTNQTTYTGGYTTSPNSPTDSLQQHYNTSSTSSSKKKRGRPSKEHSDRPDPEKLRCLPESERKKREDRAKNNEASRQSRLKNKIREEQEIKEEEDLVQRNTELISLLKHLNMVERKLKREVEHNFNLNKS